MKEKIREELWNLHRKADQSRSIHGLLHDRYDRLNRFTQFFVAIGSAVAAMLIFADIPTNYQFWVGILSAIIFIVSMLPYALKFDDKIQERGLAINQLGKWIRDTSNFLNTELDNLSENKSNEKKLKLLEGYKEIMESTPSIPQGFFNKGKQKHLQKVEISKALDKTPFKSIRKIKSELKKSSINKD